MFFRVVYLEFISDTELLGSGSEMIFFRIRVRILLKVSDPTGSGSTTLPVSEYVCLNQDRDCSSCYPDHRLHISTCVEVCPLRTRPAQAVNFCLACPHACAACSGEKCSACISGIFLM